MTMLLYGWCSLKDVWKLSNSILPSKEPYQEIVDLDILKNPNFQPLQFDTAKKEISNIEIDRARL